MSTPYEILGVPVKASDDEIRAAYLAKVKEFPPERDAAQFERIRDAYDALRDPRSRARALLRDPEAGRPLVRMLDDHKPRRLYAGPQAWREVLSK